VATRKELGWTLPPFEVPPESARAWNARDRGQAARGAWSARFEAYRAQFPKEAAEFERRVKGELPAGLAAAVTASFQAIAAKADPVATRKASQNALDALAPGLPEFFGGSADLTGSNLTNFKGSVKAGRDVRGNHLSYGVREFGMAAIMNGIALHGGHIPYGGTFLTFSDYSRNAIRMAALMKLRVIHVFTHDSIGLGEDGPTHQSVEHTPSLRLIPGLDMWRPADGLETLVAWACAVERKDGPSALALSRQAVPRLAADAALAAKIRKGGYVLAEAPGARAVIIGTGTETSLAMEAHTALLQEGIPTRVVSMPSTSVFDRQDQAYRDSVLPVALPTVAVEAASVDGWYKYVGRGGKVVGMTTFGESAPAKDLYKFFGITTAKVVEAVKSLL
jgi:transketolase